MPLTRERPRTSARALMPAPAPLPSLSDALARRAAIFGAVDLDEAPATAVGFLKWCAATLRSVADLLEPQGRTA